MESYTIEYNNDEEEKKLAVHAAAARAGLQLRKSRTDRDLGI